MLSTYNPSKQKRDTLHNGVLALNRHLMRMLPHQTPTLVTEHRMIPDLSKREMEFRQGRENAHALLQQMECATTVGRADDKTPIWPEGFVGSISHSNRWTWVTVGKQSLITSMGIDTEPIVNTGTRNMLEPEIATSTEWHLVGATGLTANQAFTLVFSAKEAFYKCWYPHTKQFLEFHQIIVDEVGEDYLTIRSDEETANNHHIKPLKVRYYVNTTDVFTATWMNR